MSYKFLFFNEIGSTNQFCLDNINNLKNKTVVWTTHQTLGRGQRKNSWLSTKDKSLCFSLVIKPKSLLTKNALKVVQLTSKAIYQALSPLVKDIWIKSPNDIYINNNKLGGILCETHSKKNKITTIILGIGININQSVEDIKTWNLAYPTISLLLANDDLKPFIIKEVLNSLLYHINQKLNL